MCVTFTDMNHCKLSHLHARQWLLGDTQQAITHSLISMMIMLTMLWQIWYECRLQRRLVTLSVCSDIRHTMWHECRSAVMARVSLLWHPSHNVTWMSVCSDGSCQSAAAWQWQMTWLASRLTLRSWNHLSQQDIRQAHHRPQMTSFHHHGHQVING